MPGTLAAQTAQCCSEGGMKWSGEGIRCLKHGTLAMGFTQMDSKMRCYSGPTVWPRLGRRNYVQEEGMAKMYLHQVQAHAELVAVDIAGEKPVRPTVVEDIESPPNFCMSVLLLLNQFVLSREMLGVYPLLPNAMAEELGQLMLSCPRPAVLISLGLTVVVEVVEMVVVMEVVVVVVEMVVVMEVVVVEVVVVMVVLEVVVEIFRPHSDLPGNLVHWFQYISKDTRFQDFELCFSKEVSRDSGKGSIVYQDIQSREDLQRMNIVGISEAIPLTKVNMMFSGSIHTPANDKRQNSIILLDNGPRRKPRASDQSFNPNPKVNRKKTAQIIFETFNNPAMCMAIQVVLSWNASGILGPDRLPQEDLNKAGSQLHPTTEWEIVHDIKEKLCYTAWNFGQEVDTAASSCSLEKSCPLSDRQVIVMGNERFQCLKDAEGDQVLLASTTKINVIAALGTPPLTVHNGVCREPAVAHTLSCAEARQKRHHLHRHIMPARDWLCRTPCKKSLQERQSPTSIWFRTNVLNLRFSHASVCKNAHELLTEEWKNSVIPSEDIADPAVENPEGTL
ncbi:hypothetical protein U0070_000744 [Myodes glareolus]|uniref:Uncharacterized protein n=1 Tax=Myodes glareolus TaxID=447135 RepID=A0AAW0J5Y5_MYOGA